MSPLVRAIENSLIIQGIALLLLGAIWYGVWVALP
jgi:hypothetical protein